MPPIRDNCPPSYAVFLQGRGQELTYSFGAGRFFRKNPVIGNERAYPKKYFFGKSTKTLGSTVPYVGKNGGCIMKL